MKKLYKLIPLLVAGIALSACGYSLRELYNGDSYNSPNFLENYYSVKESSFDNAKLSKKTELNSNQVFLKFGDEKFKELVPSYDSYDYKDQKKWLYSDKKFYGEEVKMSKFDDTFKYGMISKLFDGQLFCDGDYQLSRMQLNETGFSTKFKKEGSNFDYFMMNFKGATVLKTPDGCKIVPESFMMNVNLDLKVYMNSDSGLIYEEITCPISFKANNIDTESQYFCFGFSMKNDFSFERVVGVSLGYELTSLEMISGSLIAVDPSLYYTSMFLYEMSMPNSIWR